MAKNHQKCASKVIDCSILTLQSDDSLRCAVREKSIMSAVTFLVKINPMKFLIRKIANIWEPLKLAGVCLFSMQQRQSPAGYLPMHCDCQQMIAFDLNHEFNLECNRFTKRGPRFAKKGKAYLYC